MNEGEKERLSGKFYAAIGKEQKERKKKDITTI